MTATGYVSTTGDIRKVSKSGDVMTGELTLPDSSPDQALNAASKGYVDTVAATKAALAHAAQHAAAGSDPVTLTQAQITGLAAALAALAPLAGATFTGAVTVSNVAFNVTGYTTLAGAQANGDFTVFGALSAQGNVGFYGATPASKPTVTGSRGGNAALASLLTKLASLGLITDGTTA